MESSVSCVPYSTAGNLSVVYKQVVRIRSQAKVVNRAGDLSLHVGLVGMDWNEEERSQSPGDGGGGGGGRRFVWETVVHPGEI